VKKYNARAQVPEAHKLAGRLGGRLNLHARFSLLLSEVFLYRFFRLNSTVIGAASVERLSKHATLQTATFSVPWDTELIVPFLKRLAYFLRNTCVFLCFVFSLFFFLHTM